MGFKLKSSKLRISSRDDKIKVTTLVEVSSKGYLMGFERLSLGML